MSKILYDIHSLKDRGLRRAKALPKRLRIDAVDIVGRRVLEFGCGRGEVTVALRRALGADAIGVDVENRWAQSPEYAEFVEAAEAGWLYCQDILDGWPHGKVDFIHSYAVFEHVRKPIETIKALYDVLNSGGRAYLNFNLYRGASAAHLRKYLPEHPWVHLTHSEAEIRAMMQERHGLERGASWVNKMTYAHYLHHFREIGFKVLSYYFNTFKLPDGFYEKHSDKLACYPQYELERDFMHVRLLKP